MIGINEGRPGLSTENKKPVYGIAAVFLVIMLSRLPFHNDGFGTDPDAWRVANAAKDMVDSSGYIMSRPLGNPIHEIASAPLFLRLPVVLERHHCPHGAC